MQSDKSNLCVTEILSTMILLVIAVGVISSIYLSVFSNLNPSEDTIVDLVGRIESGDIIIEHHGGENLELDTEVMLTIGGRNVEIVVGDYLDNSAKEDGNWNIGEKVIYPSSEFSDIEELELDIISVVDTETNSLLLFGLLQSGDVIPYESKGAIWLFDEGTGSIAYDSSGNNNHGSIMDGKWNSSTSVLNTSLYFDGVNDYVLVENSFSLMMTDEITIEAWLNPLGNVASIDDYTFDSAFAYNPDVIHITDGIYAIAYIDQSSDVIIKTLIVEDDGNIESGWIDDLDISAIDTDNCDDPNLIRINGDVFGVCYSSENQGSGFVKTFRINSSGFIFNDLSNNIINFDTTNCFYPNITHIDGDIYAIAYGGKSNGSLITIEILSNGEINGSIIDNFEFNSDTIEKPRIINVNNDIYTVSYISKTNDLVVNTFEILPTGEITNINSLTLDTNQCNDPDIIHISEDVFAISYAADMKNKGNLITFEINNSGIISGIIDTLIFDENKCEDPDIIQVLGETYTNYYAIAYASSTPHVGQVITVVINPDGQINNEISYEFVYNGHHGFEPKIIPVFGDLGVYLVVYRGYSPHTGYISTTLTIQDPTLPKDRGIFKDGVFSIFSNATHVFGSINDITISNPISLDWLHIVLTYNGVEIKLYLDGVLVNSTSHSGTLNTNSNDIVIGYLYHGYIDEVYIYENALSDLEILEIYNKY
jgi:hypothetical protein